MECHLVPCHALFGGNQEGNSCAFQHSDFDANKRRAKDLLTLHVCLFIFWNHLGVCLATFLFSGACGLVGAGLGQKENRKILRESTGCDRKLSDESGVGWLHCVKSARVLEGCGQEMGLLSQWRGPCSMSQGPRTDTP